MLSRGYYHSSKQTTIMLSPIPLFFCVTSAEDWFNVMHKIKININHYTTYYYMQLWGSGWHLPHARICLKMIKTHCPNIIRLHAIVVINDRSTVTDLDLDAICELADNLEFLDIDILRRSQYMVPRKISIAWEQFNIPSSFACLCNLKELKVCVVDEEKQITVLNFPKELKQLTSLRQLQFVNISAVDAEFIALLPKKPTLIMDDDAFIHMQKISVSR